ncbi:MAG: TlpA disulfide reductase family protein [Acidimicrobiia bacterium]
MTAVLLLAAGACSDSSAPESTSTPELETAPAGAREALGAGDAAPDFHGALLGGGDVDLPALEGRPFVLNFWLTTCEPCIREMPALALVMDDNDDLVVVGVNFGESPDHINAFLDAFEVDIDFPILLDPDGDVTFGYEVVALPTSYFVDSGGIIRYRRVGELFDEHIAVGVERITQ